MTTMQPVSLSGLSQSHHSEHRRIWQIAKDIRANWPKPYYGAVPYLEAMRELATIDDNYGQDSASSIINYFLANANTFRGEAARALKKELNALLK